MSECFTNSSIYGVVIVICCSHIECVEEDQLQLALALSASIDQPPLSLISDPTEQPPKRLKRR